MSHKRQSDGEGELTKRDQLIQSERERERESNEGKMSSFMMSSGGNRSIEKRVESIDHFLDESENFCVKANHFRVFNKLICTWGYQHHFLTAEVTKLSQQVFAPTVQCDGLFHNTTCNNRLVSQLY